MAMPNIMYPMLDVPGVPCPISPLTRGFGGDKVTEKTELSIQFALPAELQYLNLAKALFLYRQKHKSDSRPHIMIRFACGASLIFRGEEYFSRQKIFSLIKEKVGKT